MSFRRAVARNVVELRPNEEPSVPTEIAASPLYGVAMLKIAMELKKADARPVDELITGVLRRMSLPEEDFRAFLAMNGGLLKTIAQKRRY
jgi:hypothetical protein